MNSPKSLSFRKSKPKRSRLAVHLSQSQRQSALNAVLPVLTSQTAQFNTQSVSPLTLLPQSHQPPPMPNDPPRIPSLSPLSPHSSQIRPKHRSPDLLTRRHLSTRLRPSRRKPIRLLNLTKAHFSSAQPRSPDTASSPPPSSHASNFSKLARSEFLKGVEQHGGVQLDQTHLAQLHHGPNIDRYAYLPASPPPSSLFPLPGAAETLSTANSDNFSRTISDLTNPSISADSSDQIPLYSTPHIIPSKSRYNEIRKTKPTPFFRLTESNQDLYVPDLLDKKEPLLDITAKSRSLRWPLTTNQHRQSGMVMPPYKTLKPHRPVLIDLARSRFTIKSLRCQKRWMSFRPSEPSFVSQSFQLWCVAPTFHGDPLQLRRDVSVNLPTRGPSSPYHSNTEASWALMHRLRTTIRTHNYIQHSIVAANVLLGIRVPKNMATLAVQRHKILRKLKAAFRKVLPQTLSPLLFCDIIVTPNIGVLLQPPEALEAEIRQCFEHLLGQARYSHRFLIAPLRQHGVPPDTPLSSVQSMMDQRVNNLKDLNQAPFDNIDDTSQSQSPQISAKLPPQLGPLPRKGNSKTPSEHHKSLLLDDQYSIIDPKSIMDLDPPSTNSIEQSNQNLDKTATTATTTTTATTATTPSSHANSIENPPHTNKQHAVKKHQNQNQDDSNRRDLIHFTGYEISEPNHPSLDHVTKNATAREEYSKHVVIAQHDSSEFWDDIDNVKKRHESDLSRGVSVPSSTPSLQLPQQYKDYFTTDPQGDGEARRVKQITHSAPLFHVHPLWIDTSESAPDQDMVEVFKNKIEHESRRNDAVEIGQLSNSDRLPDNSQDSDMHHKDDHSDGNIKPNDHKLAKSEQKKAEVYISPRLSSYLIHDGPVVSFGHGNRTALKGAKPTILEGTAPIIPSPVSSSNPSRFSQSSSMENKNHSTASNRSKCPSNEANVANLTPKRAAFGNKVRKSILHRWIKIQREKAAEAVEQFQDEDNASNPQITHKPDGDLTNSQNSDNTAERHEDTNTNNEKSAKTVEFRRISTHHLKNLTISLLLSTIENPTLQRRALCVSDCYATGTSSRIQRVNMTSVEKINQNGSIPEIVRTKVILRNPLLPIPVHCTKIPSQRHHLTKQSAVEPLFYQRYASWKLFAFEERNRALLLEQTGEDFSSIDQHGATISEFHPPSHALSNRAQGQYRSEKQHPFLRYRQLPILPHGTQAQMQHVADREQFLLRQHKGISLTPPGTSKFPTTSQSPDALQSDQHGFAKSGLNNGSLTGTDFNWKRIADNVIYRSAVEQLGKSQKAVKPGHRGQLGDLQGKHDEVDKSSENNSLELDSAKVIPHSDLNQSQNLHLTPVHAKDAINDPHETTVVSTVYPFPDHIPIPPLHHSQLPGQSPLSSSPRQIQHPLTETNLEIDPLSSPFLDGTKLPPILHVERGITGHFHQDFFTAQHLEKLLNKSKDKEAPSNTNNNNPPSSNQSNQAKNASQTPHTDTTTINKDKSMSVPAIDFDSQTPDHIDTSHIYNPALISYNLSQSIHTSWQDDKNVTSPGSVPIYNANISDDKTVPEGYSIWLPQGDMVDLRFDPATRTYLPLAIKRRYTLTHGLTVGEHDHHLAQLRSARRNNQPGSGGTSSTMTNSQHQLPSISPLTSQIIDNHFNPGLTDLIHIAMNRIDINSNLQFAINRKHNDLLTQFASKPSHSRTSNSTIKPAQIPSNSQHSSPSLPPSSSFHKNTTNTPGRSEQAEQAFVSDNFVPQVYANLDRPFLLSTTTPSLLHNSILHIPLQEDKSSHSSHGASKSPQQYTLQQYRTKHAFLLDKPINTDIRLYRPLHNVLSSEFLTEATGIIQTTLDYAKTNFSDLHSRHNFSLPIPQLLENQIYQGKLFCIMLALGSLKTSVPEHLLKTNFNPLTQAHPFATPTLPSKPQALIVDLQQWYLEHVKFSKTKYANSTANGQNGAITQNRANNSATTVPNHITVNKDNLAPWTQTALHFGDSSDVLFSQHNIKNNPLFKQATKLYISPENADFFHNLMPVFYNTLDLMDDHPLERLLAVGHDGSTSTVNSMEGLDNTYPTHITTSSDQQQHNRDNSQFISPTAQSSHDHPSGPSFQPIDFSRLVLSRFQLVFDQALNKIRSDYYNLLKSTQDDPRDTGPNVTDKPSDKNSTTEDTAEHSSKPTVSLENLPVYVAQATSDALQSALWSLHHYKLNQSKNAAKMTSCMIILRELHVQLTSALSGHSREKVNLMATGSSDRIGESQELMIFMDSELQRLQHEFGVPPTGLDDWVDNHEFYFPQVRNSGVGDLIQDETNSKIGSKRKAPNTQIISPHPNPKTKHEVYQEIQRRLNEAVYAKQQQLYQSQFPNVAEMGLTRRLPGTFLIESVDDVEEYLLDFFDDLSIFPKISDVSEERIHAQHTKGNLELQQATKGQKNGSKQGRHSPVNNDESTHPGAPKHPKMSDYFTPAAQIGSMGDFNKLVNPDFYNPAADPSIEPPEPLPMTGSKVNDLRLDPALQMAVLKEYGNRRVSFDNVLSPISTSSISPLLISPHSPSHSLLHSNLTTPMPEIARILTQSIYDQTLRTINQNALDRHQKMLSKLVQHKKAQWDLYESQYKKVVTELNTVEAKIRSLKGQQKLHPLQQRDQGDSEGVNQYDGKQGHGDGELDAMILPSTKSRQPRLPSIHGGRQKQSLDSIALQKHAKVLESKKTQLENITTISMGLCCPELAEYEAFYHQLQRKDSQFAQMSGLEKQKKGQLILSSKNQYNLLYNQDLSHPFPSRGIVESTPGETNLIDPELDKRTGVIQQTFEYTRKQTLWDRQYPQYARRIGETTEQMTARLAWETDMMVRYPHIHFQDGLLINVDRELPPVHTLIDYSPALKVLQELETLSHELINNRYLSNVAAHWSLSKSERTRIKRYIMRIFGAGGAGVGTGIGGRHRKSIQLSKQLLPRKEVYDQHLERLLMQKYGHKTSQDNQNSSEQRRTFAKYDPQYMREQHSDQYNHQQHHYKGSNLQNLGESTVEFNHRSSPANIYNTPYTITAKKKTRRMSAFLNTYQKPSFDAIHQKRKPHALLYNSLQNESDATRRSEIIHIATKHGGSIRQTTNQLNRAKQYTKQLGLSQSDLDVLSRAIMKTTSKLLNRGAEDRRIAKDENDSLILANNVGPIDLIPSPTMKITGKQRNRHYEPSQEEIDILVKLSKNKTTLTRPLQDSVRLFRQHLQKSAASKRKKQLKMHYDLLGQVSSHSVQAFDGLLRLEHTLRHSPDKNINILRKLAVSPLTSASSQAYFEQGSFKNAIPFRPFLRSSDSRDVTKATAVSVSKVRRQAQVQANAMKVPAGEEDAKSNSPISSTQRSFSSQLPSQHDLVQSVGEGAGPQTHQSASQIPFESVDLEHTDEIPQHRSANTPQHQSASSSHRKRSQPYKNFATSFAQEFVTRPSGHHTTQFMRHEGLDLQTARQFQETSPLVPSVYDTFYNVELSTEIQPTVQDQQSMKIRRSLQNRHQQTLNPIRSFNRNKESFLYDDYDFLTRDEKLRRMTQLYPNKKPLYNQSIDAYNNNYTQYDLNKLVQLQRIQDNFDTLAVPFLTQASNTFTSRRKKLAFTKFFTTNRRKRPTQLFANDELLSSLLQQAMINDYSDDVADSELTSDDEHNESDDNSEESLEDSSQFEAEFSSQSQRQRECQRECQRHIHKFAKYTPSKYTTSQQHPNLLPTSPAINFDPITGSLKSPFKHPTNMQFEMNPPEQYTTVFMDVSNPSSPHLSRPVRKLISILCRDYNISDAMLISTLYKRLLIQDDLKRL